jgi:hypothetical protein
MAPVDPFLNEHIEGLSTLELMSEVLLHAGDYTPEAIAVYQEHLTRRIGDIRQKVDQATELSGAERFRIWNVEHFNAPPLQHLRGELVGYERGLGLFLAPERGNRAIAVSAGSELLFAMIWGGDQHRGAREQGRQLPCPLMAELGHACFVPRASMRDVEFHDLRMVIHLTDDTRVTAMLPRPGKPEVQAWATEQGLPCKEIETPGLLSSLRGWFGGKNRP